MLEMMSSVYVRYMSAFLMNLAASRAVIAYDSFYSLNVKSCKSYFINYGADILSLYFNVSILFNKFFMLSETGTYGGNFIIMLSIKDINFGIVLSS